MMVMMMMMEDVLIPELEIRATDWMLL